MRLYVVMQLNSRETKVVFYEIFECSPECTPIVGLTVFTRTQLYTIRAQLCTTRAQYYTTRAQLYTMRAQSYTIGWVDNIYKGPIIHHESPIIHHSLG